MYFTLFLTVAALVSLVKCSPILEPTENNILDTRGINIQDSIHFNHTHVSGAQRIPTEYSFSQYGDQYVYTPITFNGRKGCIGMDWGDAPAPNCGWADNQYSDVFAAMDEQVTKNGKLEMSKVGCWNVSCLTSLGLFQTEICTKMPFDGQLIMLME